MSKSIVLSSAAIVVMAAGLFAQDRNEHLVLMIRFADPSFQTELLAEMQRELASAFQPVEPKLEWVIAPDLPGFCENCRLLFVTFLGHCVVRPWTPEEPTVKIARWLGRTLTTNGELYPYIEIDCGRTLAFVRTGTILQIPLSVSQLGRALARVLAHELYHVLADTKVHGSSVLTSSKFRPSDLLYHHLAFEERDLRRMFPCSREFLRSPRGDCRAK
jgi:hypothetical protein